VSSFSIDKLSECLLRNVVTCDQLRKKHYLCIESVVKHRVSSDFSTTLYINPLALDLDIYSSAHHLCEMWLFYEPRRV